MSPQKSVSASRIIAAPANVIFDLLANPHQHVLLDGSGTVKGVKSGPDRLSLGATFSMAMKIKANYTTKNVVTVFEPNKAIAWHHAAKFTWRYDLEEVPEGTKVTESFSYGGPRGFIIGHTSFPRKNQAAMVATLERLDAAVTS